MKEKQHGGTKQPGNLHEEACVGKPKGGEMRLLIYYSSSLPGKKKVQKPIWTLCKVKSNWRGTVP